MLLLLHLHPAPKVSTKHFPSKPSRGTSVPATLGFLLITFGCQHQHLYNCIHKHTIVIAFPSWWPSSFNNMIKFHLSVTRKPKLGFDPIPLTLTGRKKSQGILVARLPITDVDSKTLQKRVCVFSRTYWLFRLYSIGF